jgi:hypothetical protein
MRGLLHGSSQLLRNAPETTDVGEGPVVVHDPTRAIRLRHLMSCFVNSIWKKMRTLEEGRSLAAAEAHSLF